MIYINKTNPFSKIFMGWLGDIAILGAVLVGGWWVINNLRGSASGSGGGTFLPPLEGGAPAETGLSPIAKPKAAGEDAARIAMGLSSYEDCNAAGNTITDARCATYQGVTYIQVTRSSGAKCIARSCGTTMTKAMKDKIKKCKCNHVSGMFSAQEAAKGAQAAYYYSYATRPYKLASYNYGHTSPTEAHV